MSKEWLLGLLIGVVVALIMQVLVRLWQRTRLDRRGIVMGGLSLSCLVVYFILEDGLYRPFPLVPFGHKLVLCFAILFSFSSVWRAILWLGSHFRRGENQLQIPPFLWRLFGWILFALVAMATAHEVFGVKLTGVLITSTVASAVVGLSLQSLLANLFAGVALQMEKHFSIGDWVNVGGQEGKILRQDWRSMTLLSLSDDLIILPNTLVAKEAIVNHMFPQATIRLDAIVCVAFAHPPGLVKACMLATLQSIPEVIAAPAPSVHIHAFGDVGIKYQLRFWIDALDQRSHTRDIVLTRLWYALARHGFDVPLTTQTTEVQLRPTQAQEMKKETAVQAIKRCLQGVSLFGFNQEQIDLLADAAQLHRYTIGESLVRQGEKGDSLMILAAGEVGIYARNKDDVEVKVDTRRQGDFFGEMSLLTGEARSASAVAEAETTAVVIGKDAFAHVLSADPAILSLMLDALETRRLNLASQLAASPSQRASDAPAQRSRLLLNISRFLGIKLD